MAKHYLLKRPDSKFNGRQTHVRDLATSRIVDTIPDLSSGRFQSVWLSYELALQSVTKGADILSVLNLRRKLQSAADAEDANYDTRYIVITDVERNLLVEAIRSFDWTFSQAKGSMGTQFFVTWPELFEALINPESDNYGLTEYDINRPSPAYMEDVTAFDARKAEVDARFVAAKEAYVASKSNKGAPVSDTETSSTETKPA